MLVKKKDGSSRMCIDYRQLNTMVLKDAFPVPVIDEVLEKLQSAKYFSVMDLENGFFHVPIEPSSRKFTAFVTKTGLYEFLRAPFGFCNSPAVFIRYVNYVFQPLLNSDVMNLYMDDIIVHGVTAEECLEKMKKVFEKLVEYGLHIKWKKCQFLQTSISFLGHFVENGTISPGQEKVVAITKFKEPSDVKAVQSFLGLTGFFRKFVKQYSVVAKPLTDLLRKDVKFEMGESEVSAFRALKEVLVKEPILVLYNREAYTELHTDASKNGFGAVLLQQFSGKMHPVFFWSKKTTEGESKLHSYILEAKAVYLAVKKFRHYLLGIQFKLVTDCIAFKQTLQKRDVPREVSAWVMFLQDFSYVAEHRPGRNLQHVDCLSRYPNEVLHIVSEAIYRIKTAQQHDCGLRAIVEMLSKGPYDDFVMKSGVLYKVCYGNELLVVPRSMEKEIIHDAHNDGHFSVKGTTHAIKQKYWILHLERKVAQVVNSCVKCIMFNKKLGHKEGFQNCIDKGDTPLHTLHMDHVGPMDATAKQYKYVLTVVDGIRNSFGSSLQRRPAERKRCGSWRYGHRSSATRRASSVIGVRHLHRRYSASI